MCSAHAIASIARTEVLMVTMFAAHASAQEPVRLYAAGADYGLVVLEGARPEAKRVAAYVLSPAGQGVLAKHGFSPASP